MRLLRLHVENFGTLRDYRMEFSDSLHVLHQENGWGKTTLAVFIKAMLYGLPATTKRSLDENERKKYTPWQGGAFGGSLEFECARGSFRVERFFGAKEAGDSFALYDLATHLESDAFSASVGEELFGIDADGFERTVYLSQRPVGKGENNSITAKLGNLLEDVDDVGSYDDAVALLEERRRYYVKTGNRGRIAELETQLQELSREREELIRKREALEAREAEARRMKDELERVRKEHGAVRAQARNAGVLRARAAHLEQRARMLSELEALDTRMKELDARLHGVHPSDEALREQQALLDTVRDAQAAQEALAGSTVPQVRTELIPEGMLESCPKQPFLSRMSAANRELREVVQQEAVMEASQNQAVLRRFPRGVPTGEQLQACRRSIEAAQQTVSEVPVRKKAPVLPILLSVLGGVLLALALLPTGMPWVFLLAGGVGLVAAVIAWSLHGASNRRADREAQARVARERARCERERACACAFLVSYGMPADLRPSDALTELSLLVRQYHEALEQTERDRARRAALLQKKQQSLSFLQSGFRLFGLEIGAREDYRDEIDALYRDLERVQRAREALEERNRLRAERQSVILSAREKLRPFLARFGLEGQADAQKSLSLVRDWETEYRRLRAESDRKTAALGEFIREKGLRADEEIPTLADDGELIARERRLQEEIEARERELNGNLGQTERLSQDADRIPEVEEQLASLEEELCLSRANARTVDLTARYLAIAKESLSTRYLDDMQASFTSFLSVLTEGAPPESVMDASFEVSLRQGGKTRSMEHFSRGWRDAVQFCVRLSLADALYREGERPFLLLDDPFVNLDDTRLTAAKHLLDSLAKRYQVIYMVCHADRG